MEPKNSAAEEVRVADESCNPNDFQEQLEQIKSILNVEENEDFSKLNEVMDIENILAIDFQDLDFDPEQILMDEPERMAKGNEDDTHRPSATSLDQNQSGSDKVALLTNQEEHDATVISESSVQMVSGTLDSSLHTIVMGESSNQRESNEQNSLLMTNRLDVEPIMQQKAMELETYVSSEGAKESFVPITEVGAIKEPENFSQKVPDSFDFSLNKDMVAEASKPAEYSKDKKVEHEMQQKDKELEEIVCTRTAINSPSHMSEDIEEGEISSDDGMDDRSNDVLLHDTVVLEEKKVPEVQIFKDVLDRKEHSCEVANDKDFGSNSFLVDMVDEGKIDRGRNSEKVDDSNPLLEGGRIEMQDNGVRMGIGCPAAGNHGITSEEKWDDGACNKRKRGPPTKEKKEKKKAKERKKRAEKNRELGVKRLKLHPIQKAKTVAYCRHFVRGRCHEGDKCKFSHDTVPLTKSKPCVHFARQSCMKGDDCQYDHELSKYPCNNFKENGFCSRGDRCMFSHKMPSNEDSATAACKPELKPPMVLNNSRSQQVNTGGASQQNVHALAYSTGIHSRNNTKQNVTQTVLKQPEPANKGISFPSIQIHRLAADRNNGAKAGNQIDQSPLSSVQNSTEILKRTPPVTTPKGINFLSFGKASPDDARGKNQVSRQTGPCVSETVKNLNGMLKANQSAAPHGTHFNPFGKSSVASSSSEKPVSLPSFWNNGSNIDSCESQTTADKPQNSSGISLRLPPSPLTSGQSSDRIASRFCKDTANSFQRGLFSTLAFAAKYTTQNMNQSIGSTGAQVDKETRNSSISDSVEIHPPSSAAGINL
ncbi:CCCH-type zinc finger family protein, partial [Prunus dulcis]